MTCIFCGNVTTPIDQYRGGQYTCICHHCAQEQINNYIKERRMRHVVHCVSERGEIDSQSYGSI